MASITQTEIVQHASDLRGLLISYEKANRQISALGKSTFHFLKYILISSNQLIFVKDLHFLTIICTKLNHVVHKTISVMFFEKY